MRDDTYAIAHNPAANTTKRREPPPAVLDFYEPDEVEQLAHAAEPGGHRAAHVGTVRDDELMTRRREDSQDAELYLIAAYTGLRLGELLALRWEDVNLGATRRLVLNAAAPSTLLPVDQSSGPGAAGGARRGCSRSVDAEVRWTSAETSASARQLDGVCKHRDGILSDVGLRVVGSCVTTDDPARLSLRVSPPSAWGWFAIVAELAVAEA
jgi:hypothetical protein